jgi:polysaccharide chain length determinant protein (PEP-CTERM system associated)
VVSDFGGSQDLQGFRISYSGKEPRLVAQVANQLASLFIEENLKAREQQATGTTEFLENRLQETRKALEAQEAKLRDFKMKHVGEMPEQQTADLQILGQLQSQLQLESDALSRAEQQKSYLQSMMAQSAPVLDLDAWEENAIKGPEPKTSPASRPAVNSVRATLTGLLSRYTEKHPDVQKLKKQIEDEETQETSAAAATEQAKPASAPPAPALKRPLPPPPASPLNPVLQSQLKSIDAEITKHKEEQQSLSKSVAGYRAKLDAIPLREQEITQLVRDYEMSKAHYSQLLDKQLSAETATQLEIRQKGEKFEVLDPAQPPERPSRPNRILINSVGSIAGLILGVLLAVGTELLGMAIIAPHDITAVNGPTVLGMIPIIQTQADRCLRKKRIIMAAVSAAVAAMAGCAVLLYHHRGLIY